MDLSLERPEGYLYVRRVAAHGITLIDRELTSSFLLAPDRAIENWPVTAPETLDAGHVEALLALNPELVVLGTGARQAFPAAAFMAGFLRKNIGIEVMDNAAAARTYNLLADEGRRVVAAFILPPG
ncbi:Mth938-like domain-containing protein [Rhodanobacter sp. FDAARGOS 1247]|uniref:Mth938-like domain-containing protein n=1 Tax=Rhodanobacter sp. FDAARGOS 1247 TaxID=2778082 RepID=UPI0019527D08|nr:Mth938-like domain-containing protein [Rhodanobacter sp. FDAARGOS 1247]QRP62402.1 Mth938-like domain-containing protein [Rhodanobacter sp. FDAARGOS 1247]